MKRVIFEFEGADRQAEDSVVEKIINMGLQQIQENAGKLRKLESMEADKRTELKMPVIR